LGIDEYKNNYEYVQCSGGISPEDLKVYLYYIFIIKIFKI